MKLEVFSNNLEQAYKRLRKLTMRENISFRTKIKHSNSKQISKKRLRARK